MNQAEINKMFAEAVRTVPFPRRDETGKPTSGNHTLAVHLEGLVQAIGAMSGGPKFKDAVWEAMKPIIGPRDQTMARIDEQLHNHIKDADVHGSGATLEQIADGLKIEVK